MHATYYCENCGKPVPLDAEECPHCQSRFTAVQCPQCSFIGAARLFAAGCPRCGYLSTGPTQQAPEPVQRTQQPDAKAPASQDAPEDAPSVVRQYRKSTNRLPGWFYTVASIGLLAVLIALMVIALHLK